MQFFFEKEKHLTDNVNDNW